MQDNFHGCNSLNQHYFKSLSFFVDRKLIIGMSNAYVNEFSRDCSIFCDTLLSSLRLMLFDGFMFKSKIK